MAEKKLEVLIDTNAFSHLCQIELNRSKADKWLWKYLQVFTCTAVKNEFAKRVNNRTSTERSMLRALERNQKSIPRTRKMGRLESNWLHPEYYKKQLRKDDEGERHLICTAVELVKEKKIGQIIIITDDYTAQTSFMDRIMEDISIGQIWNTPDLLTYLYLTNDSISFENIESAISDIIAVESMSWKKYKTNQDRQLDAMIKMKKYYLNKINQIKYLKTKYNQ